MGRLNKAAKTPKTMEGDVSPTMELGSEATAAWNRICAVLKDMGILSPAYAEFITIAADLIGDAHIASKDLRERGQISITERGETKNPSFTIKSTALANAYRYLTALGLSPTAIKNVTIGGDEEANPFASL